MAHTSAQKWTDDERIVLIYFASRRVELEGITDLIHSKCGTVRNPEIARSHYQRVKYKEGTEKGGPPMYNKAYNNTKCGWECIWDLHVTDSWLVERIDASARVWALKDDNDIGKAFGHYEAVIAKYTKLGQQEAVDFHIVSPSWRNFEIRLPCIDGSQPQDTQAFIEANPVKVPDWMILEIEKARYLKFSADQETQSPVPETETDEQTGESTLQTTPSSGPETAMDHDLGELGPQTTPSPAPETDRDELSGDVDPFMRNLDDWLREKQHLPTLPGLE